MKKFFEQAQDRANEGFFSADGGFSDFNYVGGGNGYDNASYLGADAAPQAPAQSNPTSLPFVLAIANSTTNNVSSVVILGANTNLFGATNFGNVAAITITLGNSGVTYTEFLQSILSNPFRCGKLYLSSTNTSQPSQPISVVTKRANGSTLTIPLFPVIDPMQNQNGVIIINTPFDVNAFTSLTTTVLASATLNMYMYPSQDINVARGLDDSSVQRQYANPQIQYAMPVRNV